jgi:hypothetical protein
MEASAVFAAVCAADAASAFAFMRVSIASRFALSFVPHVSRDAPTSGFVRL